MNVHPSLPEEQGTNCRGPRQPDGTCLVGNPVGGPNGTQCGGDRVLGDCPPNTRNSEDNPGTCVNDASTCEPGDIYDGETNSCNSFTPPSLCADGTQPVAELRLLK